MSESEKPNDIDGMTTIQKRIQQTQAMSIPEKIALAATGGREVRAILIRDSNKQVREAVLDSPRITETEIVEGVAEGDTIIIGPYRVLSKLEDKQKVTYEVEEDSLSQSHRPRGLFRTLRRAGRKRS